MVSSLINKDTKRLKADRVRALFYPFEAKTILKIPLSYSLPNDSIIWLGNKRGVFTVKSSYYVALPLVEEPSIGECSGGDYRAPLWRKMWHLKLPAKVRIFAWRACVNGLSTRMNMVTRGLDVDATYPMCGKEGESTKHALLYCKKTCDVWWFWQSCLINLLAETNDVVDVALRIMEAGTCHDLEIFLSQRGQLGTIGIRWLTRLKVLLLYISGVLHSEPLMTIILPQLSIFFGSNLRRLGGVHLHRVCIR